MQDFLQELAKCVLETLLGLLVQSHCARTSGASVASLPLQEARRATLLCAVRALDTFERAKQTSTVTLENQKDESIKMLAFMLLRIPNRADPTARVRHM